MMEQQGRSYDDLRIPLMLVYATGGVAVVVTANELRRLLIALRVGTPRLYTLVTAPPLQLLPVALTDLRQVIIGLPSIAATELLAHAPQLTA